MDDNPAERVDETAETKEIQRPCGMQRHVQSDVLFGFHFFNSPFKRGLLVIFLRQASKRCSPRRSRTDYTAVNVHAIITYWSAAILCFNSPIVAIPSSSKKECFQWTNRGFLCPRRALTIRYPGNCTAPIRLGCSLAELLPADRVRHQLHLFSRHFSGKRLLCVGI